MTHETAIQAAPKYDFYIAGASEPVPDDCTVIAQPYKFFDGIGKVIRKNRPDKNGHTATIQLPKGDKATKLLAAQLAIDSLLRDSIIHALIKQNKKLIKQLGDLGQEIEDYQSEILQLDERIEQLTK